MNKLLNIAVLGFLFVVGLNAQTYVETIDLSWEQSYNTEDQEWSVRFDEQDGFDDKGLPVLLLQYPVEDLLSIDKISVQLKVLEEKAFNAKEESYLEKQCCDSIVQVRKRFVTIRKRQYVEISIVPINYRSNEDVYTKLERFKIVIDIPKNQGQVVEFKAGNADQISEHSVLKSGRWVKVRISESGIHKIPYSLLSSWGFNNGSNVKVFGNGGNMLPKANSVERFDDLNENAVLHENNAIYFYAQGPTAWSYNSQRKMFVHQIHDYIDEAYYYLTEDVGEGLTVKSSDEVWENYTHETNEYDSYAYYELEERNILLSGRTWYGPDLYAGKARDYDFNFPNLVNKPLKILTEVIGKSNVESTMTTYVNGSSVALQTINIPKVVIGEQKYNVVHEGIDQTSFDSDRTNVIITLQYNSTYNDAFGNLNFLCLNAKEQLVLNKQLLFRNMEVTGTGNITRFYIKDAVSNTVVWDVSNHIQPVKMKLELYEDQSGITTSTGVLKEFAVFNPAADLPQPVMVEQVVNQDLHGAEVPEMLVITHPLFRDQAERLAQLHNQKSGLRCLVVEPQQVYNEFSSGQPDVSAIRDFARFLYNKKSDRFKYLLLFGDGSYDNRNNHLKNTNYILTYQSKNSIKISESYTSDDFYGFLDDEEGGQIMLDKLDIGIGRLPVGSETQARQVVDKIETYMFNPYYGPWKTTLTFVGDDDEDNLHSKDADFLTQKVQDMHPEFDINKIYFDAYKKVTSSSGDRYPDVNAAIQEAFRQGTLVFNYTGHGSPTQLAHENVLGKGEIQNMSNKDRLPLFVTATCEFSRYDNWNLIGGSAGEMVLTSPNGGGIGLLTTTRIAWSNSNKQINSNLYNYIFEEDENGEKLRVGEIIRRTKNATSATVNRLNFTLLGDPALQLNYPVNKIYLERINGELEQSKQDTLKALMQVDIEGVIENGESKLFNEGSVIMKVFDKPTTVFTLGNGKASPFSYEVFQNRIFKGVADVKNDRFSASFIIPKDIGYNVGNGRISFYGSDNGNTEAFGANNQIKVGSITENAPDDELGPDIKIWLNNTGFKDGDIVGSRPILYAEFSDKSGINTSGVGIGHDLSLVIDDNRPGAIVLNDYYAANNNDFKSGSLSYQLSALEEGKHTLYLKAWDNLNNSSMAEIHFTVELRGELKIENVLIHPNPAQPGDEVKISFEHDVPNSMLQSTLRLFDLSGRQIDQIDLQVASYGSAVSPIEYTIPASIKKGMYILQGEFVAEEGQRGVFSKKILVIR